MKLHMTPHNSSGFLISFCGLDGSGKTTQIGLLKEHLESVGKNVRLTKQPTNLVRNSDIFRNYADSGIHDGYDYRALSLFCASDRVQHANIEILPLLRNGYVVISDRYFYSCLANLLARGYTDDMWLYDVARHVPKPDIAFFLDVEVATAVDRIKKRPEEKDRYIDRDMQRRLKELYIQIAHANNGVLLSGNRSVMRYSQIIQKEVDGVIRSV